MSGWNSDITKAPRGQNIPQEQTGWQPIETAPRNGMEIILFTRWAGDGVYPCDPFDAVQIGSWVQGEWYHQKIGTPTHWKPLPSHPGIPEQGERG